jgi:hypothetical protein
MKILHFVFSIKALTVSPREKERNICTHDRNNSLIFYSFYSLHGGYILHRFDCYINLSEIVVNQAEGLTAIEVWMLTCILFVFGKTGSNYSKVDTQNFLLVRISQILNFLGLFRNRR